MNMNRIWKVLVFLVALSPSCFGAADSNGAKAAISLEVSAIGRDSQFYALDEPVWLRVSLVNKGSSPITAWISGARDHGISFEAAPGNRRSVSKWMRPVESDFASVQETLKPMSKVSFKMLLNEFLKIEMSGEVRLVARMSFGLKSAQTTQAETEFKLTFGGPMSSQRVQELIGQLEIDLNSSDTGIKTNALRSLGAINTPAALAHLGSALSDKSEEIQLTALEAMSFSEMERINEFLAIAMKSNSESVRWKAKAIADGYGKPKLE